MAEYIFPTFKLTTTEFVTQFSFDFEVQNKVIMSTFFVSLLISETNKKLKMRQRNGIF